MSSDEPDHSEIDEAIRAASETLRAHGGMRRILHEAGQPAVFLDGEDIVKEYPDGSREYLGTVKGDQSDDPDDEAAPET